MSAYRYWYKNTGLDALVLRRKRVEEGAQLRKQKRENEICSRRNMNSVKKSMQNENVSNSMIQEGTMNTSQTEIASEIVSALYTDDDRQQLLAAQKFRKLLLGELNPVVDKVIQTGTVLKFVEFLQKDDNPTLQFEAALVLTNISSNTSFHTTALIEADAVPIFIRLLDSKSENIQKEAICALGNIVLESSECRDYVLNQGILIPLLKLLSKTSRTSITRNAVWVLSNLCRGENPLPKFEVVSSCLPVLSSLLSHSDAVVLSYTGWALSYLSDDSNERIQAVIGAGVCQRLVELLMHSCQSVVLAALRTVGNIVRGDDVQTQVILNCNVLQCLLHLLSSPTEAIKAATCWTISNITAGNTEQVQAVIDANIFPLLIEILGNASFKTRREAAWAITNATSGSSPEQIRFLVLQQCIPPLCELLRIMDAEIIQVALNGLENILRLGEKDVRARGGSNPYAIMIEECYGVDKILFLQYHENTEIYQKAFDITGRYFRY